VANMKEALLKAGIKATSSENERPKVKPVEKTKNEVFQEQRNFCEVCQKTYPDVGFYKHVNRQILAAKWLCCKCADEYMIPDETRTSKQSDYSKMGIFTRRYGRTIKL